MGLAFTLNLTGGGTEALGTVLSTEVGSFFGVISTQKFDSVLVTASTNPGVAETHDLDNLQFGLSAAVPEPASWALMVAGFGLVGANMRRRNRAVVAA